MEAFPFVGAGAAAYFEWAEMFVRFRRPPTTDERNRIEKGVPAPLRDTIEWDGPLLWVASEQGVGRHIRAAYKGKTRGKVTALTTQGRFAQASTSADARFNAHIDEWLRDSHECVSILVAFRREDTEAGGTTLSRWHAESMQEVPAILAAIAKKPVARDGALAKRLAEWATREGVKGVTVAPVILAAAAEGEKRDADEQERVRRVRLRQAEGLMRTRSRTAPNKGDPSALADALAKALPAFSKRLRRTKEVFVRPGASEQSIEEIEQELGLKIQPAHRALLRAFDGGTVGEIVFLGTFDGGSGGEDDLEAFSVAHFAVPEGKYEPDSVAVARTGRRRLIAMPKDRRGEAWLLEGDVAHGVHQIHRQYKKLDAALDAALKAGRV